MAKYEDDVRDDHYLHWLALFAVAGYMWQLHGIIAAIGLFIGLIVAISATNMFVLIRFESLTALKWSRWGWIVLAFVLVGASGAEIGHVR